MGILFAHTMGCSRCHAMLIPEKYPESRIQRERRNASTRGEKVNPPEETMVMGRDVRL